MKLFNVRIKDNSNLIGEFCLHMFCNFKMVLF
jgi:hypothetical protein